MFESVDGRVTHLPPKMRGFARVTAFSSRPPVR